MISATKVEGELVTVTIRLSYGQAATLPSMWRPLVEFGLTRGVNNAQRHGRYHAQLPPPVIDLSVRARRAKLAIHRNNYAGMPSWRA